jgi:microcystin-dependent protein
MLILNKDKEKFINETDIDNSDGLDVINTNENHINQGYGDISTISFPRGMIVPFYYDNKSTMEYMDGWSICDGTNGTPDLRGRFINMYNDKNNDTLKYKINEIGGNDETLLTPDNIPLHNHIIDKNKIKYRNIRASQQCGSTDIAGWNVDGHSDYFFQASAINGNCTSCKKSGEIQLSNSGGIDNPEPLKNSPPYFTIVFIMKL